jgi:hypothetical protein
MGLSKLFLLAAAITLLLPLSSSADTLQGGVEENGIAPATGAEAVKKKIEPLPIPVIPPKPKKLQGQAAQTDQSKLQGNVNGGGLSGEVEDEDGEMLPGKATLDKSGVLKGGASKDGNRGFQSMDPDADDQELMVEWDRWRNRLLSAIQTGMQEVINDPNESNLRWDERKQMMVPKFPLGTIAWFFCQVTPDRRILNAKITKASGFPGYDHAILESIKNLEGSSILRYPRGSKRTIVSQDGGIKTAETSERRYFKFGDVEHQRTSGRD